MFFVAPFPTTGKHSRTINNAILNKHVSIVFVIEVEMWRAGRWGIESEKSFGGTGKSPWSPG
jgi:hypothetical protein